jgi:hypothetical protein
VSDDNKPSHATLHTHMHMQAHRHVGETRNEEEGQGGLGAEATLVWTQQQLCQPTTYSNRSNTVMRFPTGLNRQLPSGVNNTFPPLYTVPQRLENSKFWSGWVRVG